MAMIPVAAAACRRSYDAVVVSPAALTPFTPFPPFISVFFTLRFVSRSSAHVPVIDPKIVLASAYRDAADPAAAAAASPTSETSLPFDDDEEEDDVRPRPRSPRMTDHSRARHERPARLEI